MIRIHPSDNVEINPDSGHKFALRHIKKGEDIIKYGYPIGHATADIQAGEHVHTHNLRSSLSGSGVWEYTPKPAAETPQQSGTFSGYLRADGSAGIRNELWIIPTVGCANCIAKVLADKMCASGVPTKALTHQFGCSQLGGDLLMTQQILCGLIRHPNAGGVLVLGLGCEENHIDLLKGVLGDYDAQRVRFLNLQDCGDEIAEGMTILHELSERMNQDIRCNIPLSKLRIGIKCGGSDGYSGITANPLVGRTMERFAAHGSTILMTEIPESFGAEQTLLSRSTDRAVFDEAAGMIRRFREYYISHGEGISDNPSPGNVAGGITTLEEKSLGCVQKGGHVPLCGALEYGVTPPRTGGLYLVDGPGNDLVACTNLTAAGAHMILFTTGRGTPLCAPVPTLKIATNSRLTAIKPHWIDFAAGVLLEGVDMDDLSGRLMQVCLDCAGGVPTEGEKRGYFDIAIFKNGVTL
ncbi:MAG: altronate dehydratase [Clostridia bacterium]|nr:altronate dehydratase [Clostridia bacterium]